MNSKEMFAVLPYLKTSKPVYIRGIQFRSSKDLEGLSAESQDHLKALFSMFFLRNDLRITEMTYAFLPPSDNEDSNLRLFRSLREAQTLIGYVYSSPHPSTGEPFLSLEYSSLYLFNPAFVSQMLIWADHGVENLTGERPLPQTLQEDMVPGYEGLLNWRSNLWVVAGSRIYPQVPHFWLNISQDMWQDFEMLEYYQHSWAIRNLIGARAQEPTETETRVFTALEWHNRSSANDISEDVALVYLAIAFESLLKLEEGEQLAQRFKETVLTLLGPVPRLDSWLDQFYKARSKIVHEGSWSHLKFYATDREYFPKILKGQATAIKYRSLTAYGRQIFRLCLNTILSGAMMAEMAGLSSLLVHNQERLERICARLSQTSESPEKRIRSVSNDVLDLHEYWLESNKQIKLETVVGTGKLMIQSYLDIDPQLSEKVRGLMEAVVQQDTTSSIDEKFEGFRELSTGIRKWQESKPNEAIWSDDSFHTVRSFVAYVAMPGFILRSRYGHKQMELPH